MNISIVPHGYIYKITNQQTKKIYIGQTTQINNKNYFCGGTIVRNFIKKYGKKFFTKEILGYCYSQEELNNAEQLCIDHYDSMNRIYGYNIREGGSNGKLAESTKEKLKNRVITDEWRLHNSVAQTKRLSAPQNNPMYNKKHSISTKNKISNTKKQSGVHKLNNNIKWKNVDLEISRQIINDYVNNKLSIHKFMQKYGIGKCVVKRILKENNIQMRTWKNLTKQYV